MPEDEMVPSGSYKLTKQFRSENAIRASREIPWSRKILDLKKKKLFGRTAWGWIRVTLYFSILYLIIASYFFFWRAVVHSIFPHEGKPRWLKGAPGLSVFPTNESTISYYRHLMADIYPLADKIDKYMSQLEDNAEDYFDECNIDDLWGFPSGKPCVFVKLNYVMGYSPVTYDTPAALPSNAPGELADIVTKYAGVSKIWLTCKVTEGPTPKFQYIPGPYFTVADDKLPIKGTARVVAVQLNDLKPNSKTYISCKVWAKNIRIDTNYNGIGHVKFSVEMRTETVKKPGVDSWATTASSPARSHDHDSQDVMPLPPPVDERKQNMQSNLPALPMVDTPEGEVDVPPLPPLEPPEGVSQDKSPTEPPSL